MCCATEPQLVATNLASQSEESTAYEEISTMSAGQDGSASAKYLHTL